jgi:hypothetical protein
MKRLIIFVSVLVLVAFVSGVMAQGKPAPAKEEKPKIEKFSGVIEKVDEAAKSIDVKRKVGKEEKILTFATTADTKITRGKETLTFADLKPKMSASIEYKKDGDKNVAIAIKVAVPKAAPKKEKKPEEAPKK